MEHTQIDAGQLLSDLASEDSETVRAAAFQAGDLRVREAIPLLCERISSEHIGIQEAAEYALRKIRGREAIDALLPLLGSDDAPVRNVTMDILREIGADGIDAMQPFLRGNDPDVRIFVADILGHCRQHRAGMLLAETLLKDPEVNVRYQAAVSLGTLAYPESVPPLCQAMHDEEWVQFAVVEALAKIRDRSAVQALVQLLPSSSDLVSSAIVDALGRLGDVKIIPMLTKYLENVSVAMRHKIVRAIVQILTVPALSLLPAKSQDRLRFYLLEALTDGDEGIQLAAVQGLGAIGKDEASGGILDLAVTVDPDRQGELFEACVRAIGSIGFNDCLGNILAGEDWARITLVIHACRFLEDRRAMEAMKAVFWRVDLGLQRMILPNVIHLATCDDFPFFLEVMQEISDIEIQRSALVFFGSQLGCLESEDVAFAALEHEHDGVKERALDACINLHSPRLNEKFREMFASEDPVHRTMAVYALGRYSVTENIGEIIAALEDGIPTVRQAAVETFLGLGGQAEAYLPQLLPRLADPDRNVRLALVDLLGQMDTPAVIPHLVAALGDADDWVQVRAVEALGLRRCGDVVPTLAQMLETANPMVIFKVIEALGRIGGNIAFNVLLDMINHDDREIQVAAGAALEAIQARQE